MHQQKTCRRGGKFFVMIVLMKAMRLEKAGPIESLPLHLEELPRPAPQPGQVLLKVSACGVCHTDLHIAEGDLHPPHLPLTLGHQVVGVVEEAAPASRLLPGQRVGVAWMHTSCGTCEFCRRGESNLCPQARFTGFHVDGGFAQWMTAAENACLPLPEGMEDEQVAPFLCAGIIGYRSLHIAGVKPGDSLGLAGFGASAHLAIQVARHWGCRVYVFTRSLEHRRHALSLGAAWAGGLEDEAPAPLDCAILFAPSGSLVPPLLSKLRPGGVLAINAVTLSDLPAMPYSLLYGERVLRSVANATLQDGLEFLSLAQEIGMRSSVELYPLDQANQALADLKASRLNGEAVLVL